MTRPVVSVVVPTVGRPTLPAALASLVAQTDPRWQVVVVGDGIDPQSPTEARVSVTRTAEPIRDAGLVRNAGLPLCRGEWVGFLDDDDTLTHEYVADLAAAPPDAAAVLFRLRLPDGSELPRPGAVGHGVSFAVRADFLTVHGLRFDAGHGEDQRLLAAVRAAGGRVVESGAVRYLVRPGPRVVCRACGSDDTGPVPFTVPASAGEWWRCRACGSDTAGHDYDPGTYTPEYLVTHAGTSDMAHLRDQVRSNCDWYGHHADGIPNKDFLDVGCADGAALEVMASLGYAVHGFDVVKPAYYGPHVTVGAVFSRWLFPLRYGYVMCREVLEHVPDPDRLLHELHGVTCPGGLVQVQTPKPLDHFHGVPYQMAHLVLISPPRLRTMLAGAMLDVIDSRGWETGQAYLCRARR